MRTLASPTPARRLVSIAEAADYLGVGDKTIRRRISAGEIVGYRTGPRLIRVDLDQVDATLCTIPAGGRA